MIRTLKEKLEANLLVGASLLLPELLHRARSGKLDALLIHQVDNWLEAYAATKGEKEPQEDFDEERQSGSQTDSEENTRSNQTAAR